MKKSMKKYMPYLGGFGALLSIQFSRFMVGKYGENVRVTIMIAGLAIAILIFAGIVYKKKYLAALGALSMLLPLAVMTIGMYLDNMYLASFGFALLFILIPIMLKVLAKYTKK